MNTTKYNPATKIWSGPENCPLYHRDISIGQAIHFQMSLNPQNICQKSADDDSTSTNFEVLQLSTRLAINLTKNLGISQLDVVGIMARNSKNLMPLVYGCFFAAVPFNPLDFTFNTEQVIHLWKRTKPKITFCDADLYQKVKSSLEAIGLNSQIYTVDKPLKGVPYIEDLQKPIDNELFFTPPDLTVDGNQTAVILCSSGTTGLSKAVCLTHRSLLLSLKANVLNNNDVIFSFSSLYWITGLSFFIFTGIFGSTLLLTTEQFSPELCLNFIEKHKISAIMLPPRYIAMLIDCPEIKVKSLSSIKMLFCGGAQLPMEIRSRIRNRMKKSSFILIGYAMTEMSSISLLFDELKPESVGTLCAHIKVKILDENGNLLGPEGKGEICVKSKYSWPGYYGDVHATESVYDSDEWYHTGDLGYFDKDGYLFVVDRIKEIMKVSGYHVSPTEIEEIILQIPGITDVCVCGIPNVLTINAPSASIIKAAGSKVTEEDVIAYVKKFLPTHKQITGGVYFVDSFPKTPSGKILRRVISSDIVETKK